MDDYLANQGIALKDGILVAAKHIEPGTTVLQQQALASVPQPTIRGQRCNYCLRKAALQCCSRCRSAYFCSNECFRNAWLQFHRVLCEPQEYDIYVDVDADRWLLERAALTLHSHNRLSKHHSHSPPHLPLAIDALHSLSSPPSSPKKQASSPSSSPPPSSSQATTADNSNTSSSSSSPKEIDLDAVARSLEPFGCHYTKDELEDLWKKVEKSTFEIVDHDQYLDTIALGVYPITSLYVRHSCRPNVGAVYKRGVQLLVALDDIAPGEPITLSYVDLLESKAERMQQLRQRFGSDYECHCARCEGDYAVLDQLLDASPEERPGYDEAELERQCQTWNVLNMVKAYQTIATPRVLDASNYTHYTSRIMAPDIYAPVTTHHSRHSNEDLHFFAKETKVMTARRVVPALVALSQVPSVPAFTLQSLRAARKLLRRLISESRWVEASRCALYLFVTYRLVYPTLHPTLSYHSLIVARSCWNSLVQLELAGIGRKLERIYENGVRTWIAVARESVYHTFGQETNLWREIVELQWVFERDQKLK